MASLLPCSCSVCLLGSYEDDDGNLAAGTLQTSKTRKQHELSDVKREKRAAQQAARLETEVMFATMEVRREPAGPSGVHILPAIHTTPSAMPEEPPRNPRPPDTRPVLNTAHDHHHPISPAARDRTLELALFESELHHRSRGVPTSLTLSFASPPTSCSDPIAPLAVGSNHNSRFESFRSWLHTRYAWLEELQPLNIKYPDRHREKLIEKVNFQLERLVRLEKAEWDRAKIAAQIPGFYVLPHQTPILVSPPPALEVRRTQQPFLLAALIMVVILHGLAGVARPYISFILVTIRAIILGAIYVGSGLHTGLSPAQAALLEKIPGDLRTAVSLLKLEVPIKYYASCPKCNMTYFPDPTNPDDPYPHVCTHRETDRPVCGEPLVKKKVIKSRKKGDPPRTVYRALRTYPYRSLHSWIADMFSRPAIEQLCRSTWCKPTSTTPDIWTDIMDAPGVRDFLGPDGVPFSTPSGDTVHLVFGMFVDWFNPHGNKQAGRHHSIGAIYLVCLNLPVHLRYLPENIYLAGIIPGPQEPSLHEINHFLHPLVDELLDLWQRGIHIKETFSSSVGCVVRAALIPLVCDIPAARKTAGFASHSASNFCSFCPLPKNDISNVDRTTWPRARTWAEHRDFASAWRDAPTDKLRDDVFDIHGLRWSELLRLPYWDPTRYTLLDATPGRHHTPS